MSDDQEAYDGPAVVEIMGKVRLAGRLRVVEMCGSKMWRLDIPTDPPLTRYYGPAALFGFTPCDEATVLRVLASMDDAEPVHRWELPRPALAAPAARQVFGGTVAADGSWTCGACNDTIEYESEADPPYPDEDYTDLANAHHMRCEPF